jgi:Fur family ferric uptake transcriptional regulator
MSIAGRKILGVLKQSGYKFTPQRRAVIEAAVSSHDHLTPAAIYEKVHQDHPNIGLVTVYRTLAVLDKLGLICEVHAGGSCRSYLLRRPDEHHHHLLCSACGRVVDFADCDLGELEGRLSRQTGFRVEGHLLEFLGLCPSCQEAVT